MCAIAACTDAWVLVAEDVAVTVWMVSPHWTPTAAVAPTLKEGAVAAVWVVSPHWTPIAVASPALGWECSSGVGSAGGQGWKMLSVIVAGRAMPGQEVAHMSSACAVAWQNADGPGSRFPGLEYPMTKAQLVPCAPLMQAFCQVEQMMKPPPPPCGPVPGLQKTRYADFLAALVTQARASSRSVGRP